MDKYKFSRRTAWPRETNALDRILDQLRAREARVLDLTASNPTGCGFVYPEGLLTALNSPENLRYRPDACGMAEARQALAAYYARQNLPVSVDHIILTAGTSEAYSFLMRLLADPAEKILIPQPSYPLFQFLLELNDIHFDYYPLNYDGQWHVDMQGLKRLIDDRTRAVVLVNPNNPTGSYINHDELNALNDICRTHQLSIISDEVFFEYALQPAGAVSCIGNQPVLTFVLGGLSKTLGLPQMKCSWILGSGPEAALLEAFARLEIIADTYLSVNTPVQNALSPWLAQASAIQGQIMARVRENHKWLSAHLNKNTQLLSLQGGWYATLRIPAVKSEEEWVLEFLKEDHVLVHPGYFFDFTGEAFIVLSLLPEPAVFQEAVACIMKRLGKI
ncbi:MAG: pyridoxal phosphate-dependent aminotransferase [Candidatus Omnitrophica bacterium]|nr:pyridoxal phosphate-dependent aminotransferase [Candidatus Omnitrophota bacterium]